MACAVRVLCFALCMFFSGSIALAQFALIRVCIPCFAYHFRLSFQLNADRLGVLLAFSSTFVVVADSLLAVGRAMQFGAVTIFLILRKHNAVRYTL